MSDWIKTEEEGVDFWINEELGNVMKLGENNYVAFAPRIIKIGPFRTEEDAQKYLEEKEEEIRQYADDYNLKYLENLKGGQGE